MVLSVLPLGSDTECLWLLQAERWYSHGTPWLVTQGPGTARKGAAAGEMLP